MTAKGVDSPNVAALFEAANKLRGSVESGEYKHLVLGPIFLKYISDAFEQRGASSRPSWLTAEATASSRIPRRAPVLEDRDEYVSENVFWVPKEAQWPALLAAAAQPDIARKIDDALLYNDGGLLTATAEGLRWAGHDRLAPARISLALAPHMVASAALAAELEPTLTANVSSATANTARPRTRRASRSRRRSSVNRAMAVRACTGRISPSSRGEDSA